MSSPRPVPPAFRAALLAVLVLVALATSRAGAQPSAAGAAAPPPAGAVVLDQGTLIVSVRGEPVRAEDFLIERRPDTLVVRAASRVSLPGREAASPDKNMIFLVGPYDFALGSYASWQTSSTGADTLRRGIQISPRDTVMTVWRQLNLGGSADVVLQPPGRMYVLDPPLFTVFNYLGWTMNGKVCDRRPVNVFVLGAQDTTIQATVTDAGNETIRWGGRAVLARKLVIADAATTFTGWYSPEDGRMYRLEQTRDEIRVERKAPPLKRPAARKK